MQELTNDNYSDINLHSIFHIEYKAIELLLRYISGKFAIVVWKATICTSCAAMELAVTRYFPVFNVELPVSLFSVCHALRLECVKSIDDTVPFRLCRRFSPKTLSSDVAVDTDSVFSESICSLYSCSHSSSQHGMWFLLYQHGIECLAELMIILQNAL